MEKRYGSMDTAEVRKVRQREEEVRRLKSLVADPQPSIGPVFGGQVTRMQLLPSAQVSGAAKIELPQQM